MEVTIFKMGLKKGVFEEDRTRKDFDDRPFKLPKAKKHGTKWKY
jgi:hypothetical protein